MKRLIVMGVFLMVGIELLALILQDRRYVVAGAGVALALVLLNVRRVLGHPSGPPADPESDDLAAGLRRWLSNTETTIRWSESTRTDWDRHLRPMLARRFEIATGQRQARDPAAFVATGEMLFGTELWQWVNPNNVTRTGDRAPGPGRAALEAILHKLEQV
ncbi:hypothetical protein [Mycobacterium szulgai]|uniref:Uncharacterized protein n=1 Tax=Mycobacterium szulgai TaxID=1787 RepID=A0A1X2F6X8_MYCSZ|nr:hypothetical protein [Mycobacterium szulgai]MCV7078699.1 hypothetical protein [Mycobacterium szulgai]ORX14193.1 hypothetical protein AWC27_19850 [Mycobacterium szulgai]